MAKIIVSIVLLMSFLLGKAAIKHPSLLFTEERVNAALKMTERDSIYAEAWKKIKQEADNQLNKSNVRKLEYLSLAFQATGDDRYSDKIKEVLKNIAHVQSWADGEMMLRKPAWRSELQMAHKAFQCAIAYDAVYNHLTPSERKEISEGLWRLAVEPLLGDWIVEPTRIHSLNSMGHNWWSSCVGMGAILGLSISNEIPKAGVLADKAVKALPEWFAFNGDVLQHKPKTFDRAGGMYESINYASFGITEALLLRMAWLNSHPGKELERIPQMESLPEFFAHVSYPRTGDMLYSINFGDSHKNVSGESSLYLAYAMGVEDPTTLWYAGLPVPGQYPEGFPINVPMGFLYRPNCNLKNGPTEPSLPLSHIWMDFGWATMRDSWKKDATMLAVKSGMTWNHSHADANSLILFHKGTDIIKDAGNCSYGKPEYRNYFFQSDAHNVVKFNGEGQSPHQQYHGTPIKGTITGLLDNVNMKYVLADGTGPMSEHLRRNFRHYLWIGSVIYIIDDIESHKPGKFEWLWHPGGIVTKKGGDIEIVNGKSSVVLRTLYPQPLAPSNYVHDYPNMMYWDILNGPKEDLSGTEEYWSLKLPKITEKVNGLTAIILKDSVAQSQLPEMERIEGKDWIGLRVKDTDIVTDIYINQLADGSLMHLNSWIEADGWATDAYMLVVRYDRKKGPEQPNDIFICHGSSLKRNGDVWFASLAKLNVMENIDKTTMTIAAEGQPYMNMYVKGNPRDLFFNGGKIPVNHEDGFINIKRIQNYKYIILGSMRQKT